MTFRELERLLLDDGWQFHRVGAGSGRIYKHPQRKGAAGVLVLHMHPSKEVPKGTLAAVLKHVGIERK